MAVPGVHLRHVLVLHSGARSRRTGLATAAGALEARAELEALRASIVTSADPASAFVDAAWRRSDCATYATGGDLGIILRGTMIKAFEDAAFSLAPEAVSEVFSTETGLHLIYRHPAADVEMDEDEEDEEEEQQGARKRRRRRRRRTITSVHVAHVLVKHEMSSNPISRRTKERVTLTKAEAAAELASHRRALVANAANANARGQQHAFMDLAFSRSDCSSYKQGGDLGVIDRGLMKRLFEDAVFALEVSELSQIVETATGLHLILRLR